LAQRTRLHRSERAVLEHVIARLDRAIQYSRSAYTGSPGRAGR